MSFYSTLNYYAIAILFLIITYTIATEKPLIIITASRNNIQWCQKYFDSVAQQKYDNWTLIYMDDASTDGTLASIMQLAHDNKLEHKITFVKNSERKGHLCNQYHAIHTCPATSIIIILDGDDWLAHDHVFEKVNEAYQDENIWLTYGQFWYLKKDKKGFCRPIPPDTIKKNAIREISWRTTHLRTFYAGLFQQIQLEDLTYKNGFFPFCADVVTMFAMIEMAGFHHKFISDILYIYNDDNPLSYHHDPTPQRELEAYIRTMRRYQPLKERTW